MTAKQEVLKEDGVTQADAHAMGAGRIQVDQAIRAGLVLNETMANYRVADPAKGGDVSALNLPSMAKAKCVNSCAFTRTFRNTLATRQTWVVRAQGVSALVSPSLLTLNPGESKAIKVTVGTSAFAADGHFYFGKLVLTPSGGDSAQPTLRLPIAVAVQPAKLESTAELALTLPVGGKGQITVPLSNIGGSNLDWQIDNAGSGVRTLAEAMGHNDSGARATRYTDPEKAAARANLGAEDFVVSEPTSISRIEAAGFLSSGSFDKAVNINWSIFRDVDGKPEGNPETTPNLAVWSHTAVPTGAGVSLPGEKAIVLDLAAAKQDINLPAGRYWLTVSLQAPFANRWVWYYATSGDRAYTTTSIDSKGAGAWWVWDDEPGLAHALQGANTCGARWIGAPTRAFGRLAAGKNADTKIQVDAAGLAAGKQVGYVCVASNDPKRPKTAVRVTLTITP
jgi:hypothetical protein